jgi:ABC-2 type transport system ATP-binding protein
LKNTPESVIEVRNLSKSYSDTLAVDDVSFEVNRGEILGILGPNGSGKTTTIKSILGLITFDSGRIRVMDMDVTRSRHKMLWHVGAVLEGARNIYWHLSPEENLTYFAGIRGLSKRSVSSRIENLLDRLGLIDVRKKEVRKLSSGMKQKIALSCSLVHDPEILLLDEPTLGLDVETSSTVRQMLLELVDREDKTFLITSHDMAFVESICDRVLIIKEGRIISHETMESLRKKFSKKVYLIRTERSIPDDCSSAINDLCQASIQNLDEGGCVLSMSMADVSTLHRVMDVLEKAGVSMVDLKVVESKLEDIFLDLVRQLWE